MTAPSLPEISRRLLRLHKSLLDDQRRVYEGTYGPVDGAQLFRLLLEHEQFAWLRPLSGLIARIDEAVETTPPLSADDAVALVEHTRRLFRPEGDASAFTARYHEALQRSAEVVMNHGDVMRALGPPRRA
jgi:hypothetical protein